MQTLPMCFRRKWKLHDCRTVPSGGQPSPSETCRHQNGSLYYKPTPTFFTELYKSKIQTTMNRKCKWTSFPQKLKSYIWIKVLTLHMLCHNPVVEQPVVFHGALHHFYQQVVSSSPWGMRLAFWLLSIFQTWQQEQKIEDVSQKLL